MRTIRALTLLGLLLSMGASSGVLAAPGLEAFSVTAGEDGAKTYTVTIQLLALMTGLTLLPAALIMMTSFTRIIIVLAILRQALGTAQTPSSQVLVGLALFLTVFVMTPVFDTIYDQALRPYLEEKLSFAEAIEVGARPIKKFMLAYTREADLNLFMEIAGAAPVDDPEDVAFSFVMPAFITSELKTAFQFGFLIFIPFLIIDLVVASVLMSMGMVLLSPLIISFPFKIMLFVLVDGWALVIGTLASSFVV